MSTNSRDRRKITTSLLLVLMFLFADLALPQAVPKWTNNELDEPETFMQTTSSFSVSKDAGIQSANPNSNYGSDETATLGLGVSGESRILISFNNSVPSGDMVTDSTLELTCGIDPLTIGTIDIFSSRLKTSWDEANVTWNSPDDGQNWGLSGADDDSDHGTWEPSFYGYANNTFTINVTAIVQDAVINSRGSIDIILAATGSEYTCHMSESTDSNSRPSLSITHQNGTHSNGGSLAPNFVDDGAALMDEDEFLLKAATNPELSWVSMSGSNAQVQLSNNIDFKSDSDSAWYYNTIDNSSLFTINTVAGEGSMVVPNGHELSNSTTMYYRMRAIDSAGTIGAWSTGNFHLPGHSVSLVDGYGQFSFSFDDLGLVEKTIEDSFIDSSNVAKNTNMGSDGNITVGSSSSTDQYGLLRINPMTSVCTTTHR